MSKSNAEPGTADPRLQGGSWFRRFEEEGLPRLRVALVSSFGAEMGAEATADAVEYAWEHRDRLSGMANPVGYLFRVGQTSGRRHLRRSRRLVLPPVSPCVDEPVDPDLPRALAQLSDRQRVAVVLVHVNGWTYESTAEAMGIDVSSVRTHVARALARLRKLLEEDDR
jgi:DNA-directed RNA polymerase specialized sigma24 family protein